jgi:hypothetical protein
MDTGWVERTASTRWRTTLRGVVLHPAGIDDPVLVTTPGDVVWEAIAEPIGVEHLVATLAEHFRADAGEVRADVEALLERLIALGAVRRWEP